MHQNKIEKIDFKPYNNIHPNGVRMSSLLDEIHNIFLRFKMQKPSQESELDDVCRLIIDVIKNRWSKEMEVFSPVSFEWVQNGQIHIVSHQ